MKKLIAAVFFSLTISAAQAVQPLDVSDPWVRATVPGQEITGAFMQLKSAVNAKLVKAESPVAEAVEIHFMSMKNGVMEMRQVDALQLPAGKVVSLAPGGYHLMLINLKKPLLAGATVPLTLVIQHADNSKTTLPISARVMQQHGR